MTHLRRIATLAAASAILTLGLIAPAQARPLGGEGDDDFLHLHIHGHCPPVIGCLISL
ncbi:MULTISPECIES: hypothetical protein [unclassified Streptomyces]|uniref:hypothetical protein n=1 Tax=unclassified Streptomyces TaxID=2593676 RepID=UPI0003691E34|nr:MULTISPECIES: hypothetical protein [unclassified Streptomyces]MYT32176.1 hypothetical protein [Streptomyces sp. SID8354]